LLESFQLFVSQIKEGGWLYQYDGIDLQDFTHNPSSVFGLHVGDFRTENLRIENAEMVFDIVYPDGIIRDCSLLTPGFHNVTNVIAAAAVCLKVGVSPEAVRDGICSFKGVKRRFEYQIRTEKMVYIDDYAHHPTEIEAFLSSVKALYPNRKLTVVFQPHLFSRTNDFQEGFARSLDLADDLLLLDIYPARELPMEGVTSSIIFDKMKLENKTLCTKSEVLNLLKAKKPELLVTVGAGDIDTLIPILRDYLQK
jgi:UDP-N-acetylmuramate--alanine ligase